MIAKKTHKTHLKKKKSKLFKRFCNPTCIIILALIAVIIGILANSKTEVTYVETNDLNTTISSVNGHAGLLVSGSNPSPKSNERVVTNYIQTNVTKKISLLSYFLGTYK